jgi:mono/diheme cytochrome c family protein
MKIKLVVFSVLALFIWGCASKKTVETITNPTNVPAVVTNAVVGVALPLDGKGLYENNCGKCHGLYNPKDFTATQWQPILVKMQNYAHLDDAQMAGISDYINSQL